MSEEKSAKNIHSQSAATPKNPPGISYQTRLLIVILLLLFIYPLGLIVMWVWMKYWPLWLKLLISLPLALILFVFIFVITFVVILLKHAATDKTLREKMFKYQQQMGMYQLSTTPASPIIPLFTSTTSPSNI